MGIFGYLPFIFIFIDIILLVLSLYTKKRSYWNTLITVNVVSLLSLPLMLVMAGFVKNGYEAGVMIVGSVVMGVLLGPLYIAILVINLILKAKLTKDDTPTTTAAKPTTALSASEQQDNAYINGDADTNKPSEAQGQTQTQTQAPTAESAPATTIAPISKKSSPALPILIGLGMVVAIVVGFYFTNEYDRRGTLESYASVKARELDAMANYLNSKYGLNVKSGDAIYYLEKDDNSYSTYGLSSTKANVPYYAIFKVGSDEIAVADRDGRISDNRQLREIDKLIAEYFADKTGLEFDYVTFSMPQEDQSTECIKYSAISKVLQTEIQDKITKDNISSFIEELLDIDRISIDFYIKDSSVKDVWKVAKELEYLGIHENIDEVRIWFYNSGDITYVVRNDLDKTDYSTTEKSWNKGTYVKDSYKFGCTYVAPNEDAEELRYLEARFDKKIGDDYDWRAELYTPSIY